ncbi:hypothetical protein IWZ03DRAFT_196867 [Phyllosticta citriasiana]|uniref:Uncharacterized protein n=1 Tax=Phyllosticta citriasiana TaxID=595635 RepID=A0ABR1KLN7_9PEZI
MDARKAPFLIHSPSIAFFETRVSPVLLLTCMYLPTVRTLSPSLPLSSPLFPSLPFSSSSLNKKRKEKNENKRMKTKDTESKRHHVCGRQGRKNRWQIHNTYMVYKHRDTYVGRWMDSSTIIRLFIPFIHSFVRSFFLHSLPMPLPIPIPITITDTVTDTATNAATNTATNTATDTDTNTQTIKPVHPNTKEEEKTEC